MKIVLTNGNEYQVSLVSLQTETQLCLGFIGVQSYDELRAGLTPESMAAIKYYTDDSSETFNTYEDYIQFVKSSTVESGNGLDVAMYFNKVDATTKSIQEVKVLVAELDSKVNSTINLDTCTLEELKIWQINLSKKNLENYLAANPITSTCHGGIEKIYTITKDKQSLLTQMILMCQMAVQAGAEYQPSWNAQGEACTYNWTLAELQQLAFEIEAVVRPLVSHQQTMEADINTAETKEAVLAITITF